MTRESGNMSWVYPKEQIGVSISSEGSYLSITLESLMQEKNKFTWPTVLGEYYIMPFHEGKYIPKDDPHWAEYLGSERWDTIELLSMAFVAVEQETYTIV